MASTSTGYARSIISREQPSSSGQVMSFTSGCTLNVQGGAVQKIQSGGEMELKSGSTVNVESGASININSGGLVKDAVVAQSSGALSMTRTGISVFSTAVAAANKITISALPMAGIRKTIVTYTTLVQTVRGASAVATAPIFGTTATKTYSLLIAPTSKQAKMGAFIELIGHSTKRWHFNCRSTAYVSLTTACT